MTKDEFNEIVKHFSDDCSLNFVRQAVWKISSINNSDSVIINVEITKNIFFDNKCVKDCFFETITTQDDPESIKCAILTLNEKLLLKLEKDNI